MAKKHQTFRCASDVLSILSKYCDANKLKLSQVIEQIIVKEVMSNKGKYNGE